MGRKSRSRKQQRAELPYSVHGLKSTSTSKDGADPLLKPSLENKCPLGAAPHFQRPYTALAVCGLLVLAVALVFGKTLLFDFVNFDDGNLVYENPMVQRGLTADGFIWALTTKGLNMWYPLTWLSYMMDTQLYGPKPWGYHLTNVLLHVATSVILFLVLRQATGKLWASAFVTFLFAIHPLRAEAVAWVGERKSTLSGLFFVSTIAAYVAYARRPFSLPRYLAVAGLFTLGLLSKPSLVTLPFLLLLLDFWPLERWRPPIPGAAPTGGPATGGVSLSWLAIEKIPLVLLSAGASAAAVLSQGNNIASLESLSIPVRIANALNSYVVYVVQFFWPAGLAPFYPNSEHLPAWQVAGACLVLVAVSVGAVMLWRKQPAVLVGWLWYLGTLVPMIGIIQIGSHARADRYTYLPDIGLAIALVWGLRYGMEQLLGAWPLRSRLYGVAGTLAVAGFMWVAWRQTEIWRDSGELWTHTLTCTSQNSTAHYCLGYFLANRGEDDEAIVHFQKALEIEPTYVDAHVNLASTLVRHGQIDQAIAHYRRALELDANYVSAHNNLGLALIDNGQVDEAIAHFRKALQIKPDAFQIHYSLAAALANRGQGDEAIDHFRRTIEIKPDFAEAHNGLGNALARRGKFEEAIAQFRKALEIKPDYAEPHYNLGLALAARGESDQAISHYRKALEIKPDYFKAHVNLGAELADCGKVDEAIDHYRMALEIKPDYADAYFNLGGAFARSGKPTEALENYQKALYLAQAQNNPALAKEIQSRLKPAGKGD